MYFHIVVSPKRKEPRKFCILHSGIKNLILLYIIQRLIRFVTKWQLLLDIILLQRYTHFVVRLQSKREIDVIEEFLIVNVLEFVSVCFSFLCIICIPRYAKI